MRYCTIMLMSLSVGMCFGCSKDRGHLAVNDDLIINTLSNDAESQPPSNEHVLHLESTFRDVPMDGLLHKIRPKNEGVVSLTADITLDLNLDTLSARSIVIDPGLPYLDNQNPSRWGGDFNAGGVLYDVEIFIALDWHANDNREDLLDGENLVDIKILAGIRAGALLYDFESVSNGQRAEGPAWDDYQGQVVIDKSIMQVEGNDTVPTIYGDWRYAEFNLSEENAGIIRSKITNYLNEYGFNKTSLQIFIWKGKIYTSRVRQD